MTTGVRRALQGVSAKIQTVHPGLIMPLVAVGCWLTTGLASGDDGERPGPFDSLVPSTLAQPKPPAKDPGTLPAIPSAPESTIGVPPAPGGSVGFLDGLFGNPLGNGSGGYGAGGSGGGSGGSGSGNGPAQHSRSQSNTTPAAKPSVGILDGIFGRPFGKTPVGNSASAGGGSGGGGNSAGSGASASRTGSSSSAPPHPQFQKAGAASTLGAGMRDLIRSRISAMGQQRVARQQLRGWRMGLRCALAHMPIFYFEFLRGAAPRARKASKHGTPHPHVSLREGQGPSCGASAFRVRSLLALATPGLADGQGCSSCCNQQPRRRI